MTSNPVSTRRPCEAEWASRSLTELDAHLRPDRQGRWRVLGLNAEAIGQLAAEHGIALHELTPRRSSLEEVYVQMTGTRVEYRATGPVPGLPAATTSSNGG